MSGPGWQNATEIMKPRDEDIEALLDELESAGLIERYVDAEGYGVRLTKTGQRITNQLAMMGDQAQGELMDALLGSDEDGKA